MIQTPSEPVTSPQVDEVIFLIHGIRTQAEWQDMVARVLATPTRKVYPLKYGYFDALRFWCPAWIGTRRSVIEIILKQFRHAKTIHPNAKMSIVAHSYGTYAVGAMLEDTPDIQIDRLVLCGCILDTGFRWDQMSHRIGHAVVNDCGYRDIWPVLARSLSWGYGYSGTYGFGKVFVDDRHHNFSHSEYFDEDFVKRFWRECPRIS